MRLMKIITIPLLLISLISALSCSRSNASESTVNSAPAASQQASSLVNGTGEIIASSDDKLAFKNGGQITRILVKEGEAVTRGQVLAKLDSSGLELSLAQAKVAQGQTRLGQAQAKYALQQAELAQAQAQNVLDQSKLAQIQANSALTAAQFNLDRTKAVKDIQDEISKYQRQIEVSKQMMAESIALDSKESIAYYIAQINTAQMQLVNKQKDLLDLLTGSETGPVMAGVATYEIGGQEYNRLVVADARTKEVALEAAQKAVDQSVEGISVAQKSLDLSKDGVTLAQKNLDQSAEAIALAQTSFDYIQKEINDCTLLAPFNGIVVDLPVQEGEIIPQPTGGVKTVIRIIAPASFQATANIDEEDIARVKPGQTAVISLKALPGTRIKGNVTRISSIPVVKPSGAVEYEVTIDINDPSLPGLKAGMSTDVDISVK